MRTYRVAPLRRETDGWTVIRSIPGEQDETLGRYSERADAQAAWERLAAAKVKGDFEFGGAKSDTEYEIFRNGDTYRVRITWLGMPLQEAVGFRSCEDASSWISWDQRRFVRDRQK